MDKRTFHYKSRIYASTITSKYIKQVSTVRNAEKFTNPQLQRDTSTYF